MLYVVCTDCTFLRAFSRQAQGTEPPNECPACGSALISRQGEGRFPSAYVSKVSLDLLAAPELGAQSRSPQ
jgi:ssDNA-binding Zn-finger/Zn-ribbon topoisomerase 1